MSLDGDQIRKLSEIVRQQVGSKQAEYFAWVDPPIVEGSMITHSSGVGSLKRNISAEEALSIYKRKLNGVYGERLVLAMCVAVAAVKAEKDVALLQISDEPHVPFDADGWLVLAIEGHPIFHISPSDLPLTLANEAGLVTVVSRGTDEAEQYGLKGTTKVDELQLLLDLFV